MMAEFAIGEGMGPILPELAGTVRDITSEKRLGLIFDVLAFRFSLKLRFSGSIRSSG
jgi:hypothetical protein